jgi:hypothetical protein
MQLHALLLPEVLIKPIKASGILVRLMVDKLKAALSMSHTTEFRIRHARELNKYIFLSPATGIWENNLTSDHQNRASRKKLHEQYIDKETSKV